MGKDIGEWVDREIVNKFRILVDDVSGENSNEIEEELKKRIMSGSKPILIDFSNVRYMTSHGVAMLLHVRKIALKENRELAMVNVHKHVYRSAFLVSGIDKVFDIYDSLQEAEAAYRSE